MMEKKHTIQKYNIQDTIRDAMVLLLALAKDCEQWKINNDNNLRNRETWCNVVRNGNKKIRVPALTLIYILVFSYSGNYICFLN